MPQGLSVSRIIDVDIILSPQAAQFAAFDTLNIIGTSDVINTSERIREYNDLQTVAEDFGTDAPEYDAAQLFFSQVPQPDQLYISRWANTPTAGLLLGGILSTAQKAISVWNVIDDGSFSIEIDGGGTQQLTGLDFTLETNLNGVADVITTALAGAVCTWSGSQFTITSDTGGVGSEVGYAGTVVGVGTDISTMLQLTLALAQSQVNGIAAETALEAVVILNGLQTSWYGCMFATPDITNEDHIEVAGFIQGTANPHIYGITSDDSDILVAEDDTDIMSTIAALGYTRTFGQYSEAPYAVASFFGRAFAVNFAGNNTTLSMMYKVEPGVAPENLTATQASTLEAKRCNVYVNYNNNTAILQYGTMLGPAWFDEIHGLDWLANQIQTNVFNILYTSPTKIPQTDAGNNVLVSGIDAACAAGVNNGLIAPGQWNSAGFGQLLQGGYLDKGYYIYAPPVSSQPQASREARQSVPFQVAVKLAGAINTVDIQVNVNR